MSDPITAIPAWASRIKKLRHDLKLTQAAFSEVLQISQVTVSMWETGKHRPVPDAFVRLAQVAPVIDKFYFLEEAGLPRPYFVERDFRATMPSRLAHATEQIADVAFYGPSAVTRSTDPQDEKLIRVPVLADPAAAGNPLPIDEAEIAEVMWLPISYFDSGANIYGVKVQGHSMHPVLNDGDIAFVELKRSNLHGRSGHMMAIWVDGGVTIKYLRRRGSQFSLVPANTSPEYEIRELGKQDDWKVIGEVVRWMGIPRAKKGEQR